MNKRNFIAAYLVIAMLVAGAWVWNQAPASASPRATGTAVVRLVTQRNTPNPCAGISGYAKEVAKAFDTPEGRWFMTFADTTGEDWLAMTPDELKTAETNLGKLAKDLDDIVPPKAAEAFHDDLIKFLQLYANVFRTAQISWIAVAASGYDAVIQTVSARFTSEATALQSKCSFTSPTA